MNHQINTNIKVPSKPLVSVDIITYNHEKYISDAIEGVLMQKTNFLIEIIICDDFSTDQTRNILINYQNKYPFKIFLRLMNRHAGLRNNYFENKAACRGKYIAICEGDDFWTDPYKLQKQVDFLEANQEYSMVFTNAMQTFDYKNWSPEPSLFSTVENKDYTGSDLMLKWIVPTATVVFRNSIPFDFTYLDNFLFYDTPLFLKLEMHGKIRGMKDITAVYRRHEKSISNQHFPLKKRLSHLESINNEFTGRFSEILPQLFAEEYYDEAKAYYKKKSYKALYFALLSFCNDSSIILSILKRKILNRFYYIMPILIYNPFLTIRNLYFN